MALERSSIASSSRPQDVLIYPREVPPPDALGKKTAGFMGHRGKEFTNLQAVSGTLPLFNHYLQGCRSEVNIVRPELHRGTDHLVS